MSLNSHYNNNHNEEMFEIWECDFVKMLAIILFFHLYPHSFFFFGPLTTSPPRNRLLLRLISTAILSYRFKATEDAFLNHR